MVKLVLVVLLTCILGTYSPHLANGHNVAPGQPTNVQAELDGTEATVTWDAPVTKGEALVSRYHIYYLPGQIPLQVEGKILTVNASIPDTGKPYSFRVVAVDENGHSSAYSERSSEVTVTPNSLSPINTTVLIGLIGVVGIAGWLISRILRRTKRSPTVPIITPEKRKTKPLINQPAMERVREREALNIEPLNLGIPRLEHRLNELTGEVNEKEQEKAKTLSQIDTLRVGIPRLEQRFNELTGEVNEKGQENAETLSQIEKKKLSQGLGTAVTAAFKNPMEIFMRPAQGTRPSQEGEISSQAWIETARLAHETGSLMVSLNFGEIAKAMEANGTVRLHGPHSKIWLAFPNVKEPEDFVKGFSELLDAMSQQTNPEKWEAPTKLSPQEEVSWNDTIKQLHSFNITWEKECGGIAYLILNLMREFRRSLGTLAVEEISKGRSTSDIQDGLRILQSLGEIFQSEEFKGRYEDQLRKGLSDDVCKIEASEVLSLIRSNVGRENIPSDVQMLDDLILKAGANLHNLRSVLHGYIWYALIQKLERLGRAFQDNKQYVPKVTYLLLTDVITRYFVANPRTYKQ